ncbi:MAG: hypothetical protein FK731_01885 [Asgard group archaeon]|nr:hypothetical protein [Asgard group archaeon]
MSQEKADSGTIIIDGKGVELGVIKKIYSENLARLELANSSTIALDLSMITEVISSGRLIKKKSAKVKDEINIFFIGASETLEQLMINCIELLLNHISTKETKKALQHFEFDFLNKYDFTDKIQYYKILGLIRGIELASKTSQDFIVKAVFQTTETKNELARLVAPEVLVDKLNQEKAFDRILWNLVRFCISQIIKLKDERLFYSILDALFDIGLKMLDDEYKIALSTTDLLYWSDRVEDCIIKYIALMIITLDLKEKLSIDDLREKYIECIRKSKINGTIRSQAIKAIENFKIEDYEQYKSTELLYAGIKGFNLRVMIEKKAMNDLKLRINSLLEKDKPISIMNIENEITNFTKKMRDVSREFLDILLQIAQYLKKLEYGDSKIQEFYSKLRENIYNKKYDDLGTILDLLNKKYRK